MQSPHAGHRQVKALTTTLIVIGAAGAIGASAVAFADTYASAPPANASTGGQSVPSGSQSPDTGFGAAPQLSTSSGRHHATSGGS